MIMPEPKILNLTTPASPVKEMHIYAELHSDSRFFTVHITQGKEHQIQIILALAKAADIPLFQSFPNCLYGSDIFRLRDFANELQSRGMINAHDRLALQPSIQKIDQIALDLLSIRPTITVAQQDLFESLISCYLEPLVEDSTSYKDMIRLIVNCLSWPLLTKQFWKQWVSKPSRSIEEIQERMQSAEHLSKFLRGEVNLSSAFIQLGTGIPSWDIQKEGLINIIRAKFVDKYGMDVPKFEQFYVELALTKLRKGKRLSRSISSLYSLDSNGFPTKDSSYQRASITQQGFITKLFDENNFLPTIEEQIFLRGYGLNRFPISAEDMVDAKAAFDGQILENPKVLRLLFDKDLYPNMSPQEQLVCAIQDDYPQAIKKLVQDFSIDINTPLFRDVDASSPMRLALQGQGPALEKLIELGGNINATDLEGRTLLIHAAAKQANALTEILLSHRAKWVVSKSGMTPLLALFRYANDAMSKESIIVRADMLMKFGNISDLNTHADEEGNTCLHFAALNAKKTHLLALLDIGIDLTIRNNQGKTAFDIITLPGHPFCKNSEIREKLAPK